MTNMKKILPTVFALLVAMAAWCDDFPITSGNVKIGGGRTLNYYFSGGKVTSKIPQNVSDAAFGENYIPSPFEEENFEDVYEYSVCEGDTLKFHATSHGKKIKLILSNGRTQKQIEERDTVDISYQVPKNQGPVTIEVSVNGIRVCYLNCKVSWATTKSPESTKKSSSSGTANQSNKQRAKELYRQGVKLFDSGKKSEGNDLIIKAADMGDDEAQCVVGILLYMHGKQNGSKQSYRDAASYLQKSANQGNTEAQYRLGMLYFDGKGVEQNYGKALQLFESASRGNVTFAQMMAGLMYYTGKGVRIDYKKAVEYLIPASEAGDADAQFLLTRAYASGNGVNQDMKKAFYWCEKSALQGNAEAQYILGCLYEAGNGVEQNISKAIYWYEKAAAQGDEDAKESLKALR